MKLFKKLKEKLGFTSDYVQYIIKYTNTLTQAQRATLSSNMIIHFNSQCRPSNISVSTQTVGVKTPNACVTGNQLKKISDDTLGNQLRADVDSIELNGNVIWSKP
jgi:hypothetical protein